MPIEVYAVKASRETTGFYGDFSTEQVAERIKTVHEEIEERNGRFVGSHTVRLASGNDCLFIVADIPPGDIKLC